MTKVSVAIMGSRDVNDCTCSAQEKHWPPTPSEKAHMEECLKAQTWVLMLKIVNQLVQKHGEELVLFSGGSPTGAEKLAEDAATMLAVTFKKMPARPGAAPYWERANDRNTKLVAKVEALVLFLAPGPRRPGMLDIIEKAMAKPIPLFIRHEGRWHTS